MDAGTLSSGPARSGSTVCDAFASGDSGSFVIATVIAPWRAPSSITAMTSGEAPDCEIPITHWPSMRGGVP